MKVGDLVKTLPVWPHRDLPSRGNTLGVVIEMQHVLHEKFPDYRTPPAILVYFSENMRKGVKNFAWFYKNELELFNECR